MQSVSTPITQQLNMFAVGLLMARSYQGLMPTLKSSEEGAVGDYVKQKHPGKTDYCIPLIVD